MHVCTNFKIINYQQDDRDRYKVVYVSYKYLSSMSFGQLRGYTASVDERFLFSTFSKKIYITVLKVRTSQSEADIIISSWFNNTIIIKHWEN